jgi:AcrR family transcriptional regulator
MDRRQEILSTASDLFRERGYHATSMCDIARSLGVQGSSLYAHIASKEEMLWEIVQQAAAAFLAEAEGVEAGLEPRTRLARLIRGHLSVMGRELPNAAVFFHEWRFLSPELRVQVVAWRDRYEAHFRAAIEDGADSGAFCVDDPKLAAIFVLSALNWSYQWYRQDGEMDLDALTERFTALALNALNAEVMAKQDRAKEVPA